MKIQVTEMVSHTFTIEVPDTLGSWAEIALEVERQRTTRDDIQRDTVVSTVEWGHKIESNEDVAKSLELFKPNLLYIPFSAVDEADRNIWHAYLNGVLVNGTRNYHYTGWRHTNDPLHSPAAVLELILKERGE